MAETIKGIRTAEGVAQIDYDALSNKPVIVNPNLLDNWYFANPVNQRGWNNAIASWSYHLDRWYANDVTVIVNDGYVTLTQSGTSNLFNLQRVKDGYYKNSLAGRIITISALLKGGILKTVTVTAPPFGSGGVSEFTIDGLILGVYSYESESGFRLFPTEGYSFDIVAFKAELGDTQTLAHQDANGNWVLNEIPNYADQLARCQRYFQIFRTETESKT